MGGGATKTLNIIWLRKVTIGSVQSTLSMQSMLYLEGSGGIPHRKNFANLAY